MLGGLGNLLGMGGSKPAPAPAPQPAPQPGGGYGYGYDYSHAIEELIKAIDALEAGEVSREHSYLPLFCIVHTLARLIY